jgi:hypothetical protein
MISAQKLQPTPRMQWVARRRREEMPGWNRITITLSAKALEVLDYVRYAQDSSASVREG